MMPGEFELIGQIQEFFGPGAKPVFWVCNFLWGIDLATRLPVVIYWLGARTIGFRVALFAAISGPITIYSKWLIAEPRPFYVSDAFTPLKVSTGFGMPSGNALGIATLMVALAWYVRRKSLWAVATIVIIMFGLARVYYGVHSPSQVVWGWLAGITLAIVLIKTAEPFVRWFHTHSISFQFAIVLVLALLVTGTGLLIDHMVLQQFVTPSNWVERYNEIAIATDEEDPFSLFNALDSYAFGGYLFGFGAAGILLLRGSIPQIESRFGKALNVSLGIPLYFAYAAVYQAVAKQAYDTPFFEAYILLAVAAFPLLYFVVTPMLTSRILAAMRSARA